MRHAGAADGLDESFLDDAVLHVEGELAGALLRRAPAHTVRQTRYVLDLLGYNPLALFGDRCGFVICTLLNATHLLHFV